MSKSQNISLNVVSPLNTFMSCVIMQIPTRMTEKQITFVRLKRLQTVGSWLAETGSRNLD